MTRLPEPPDGAWDLLVVGGGTAGIVAARTAAGFGASVLLVERDRTGGDCLWTGCVPSKALLAAAAAAADARAAGRLGVRVGSVEVDAGAVMAHVRAARTTIEPDDAPETLEAAGVRVAHGEATFVGPGTVLLDGRRVEARQCVVATGSAPTVPDLPGLADAVAAGTALTNEMVWDLGDLPGRLVVLGGGSVGCELGQAFARLGVRVSLVEAAPRLLAREDPEASAAVRSALEADGVDVRTGVAAASVTDAELVLDDGARLVFDRLLVAVGRTPRTAGLGLAAAGVETDERGHVVVDEHLRTTSPRTWAAGDVTGHPALTHVAGVHGSLVATNAVLGLRRSVDPVVPRVTFTSPEVGSVGVTTTDGPTVRHTDVDRAVAEAATAGFSRLALDGRGRVVGATVVGPRAGETLGELTLAVRRGLRTRDLAGTTHAYPTFSDGAWNAAIADVRSRLAAPAAERVVRALAAVRRRRLGS